MATGWGKRIEAALLLYSSVHGRTSLERLGELVAGQEGRDRGYAKATVSAWISESSPPTLEAFEAMADVFGCDPWWLVWGVGRGPVNPLVPLMEPAPRSAAKAAVKKRRRAEG